jgi:hypothetical protein
MCCSLSSEQLNLAAAALRNLHVQWASQQWTGAQQDFRGASNYYY